MSIVDNKEIRYAYQKEARGLINKIKKELNSFKNDSQFTSQESRFFRLFRYAHTLKGISGAMSDRKIEKIAKPLTETFRLTKEGKRKLDNKAIAFILNKLKAVKAGLSKKRIE